MLVVMVLAIAAVIGWYLRSEQQVPVPATD
jgi:predicted negative regulator of RcsB-dependent stress response